MKITPKLLISISAMSISFGIAALVGLQSAKADTIPAFPMAFWGNVTINGTAAPSGTVISAYYGSTLAGQATTTEAGVYGYSDPTKQKLLVAQGTGAITFEFQSPSYNNDVVTAGDGTQTASAFETGQTINQDLAFILPTPTPTPPSSGGGGGGGGGGSVVSSGGGGGGGGGYVSTPAPTPTISTNSTTTGQVLGASTVNGAHPNGTLILSNGAVYLISNGQLRGFRNATEYQSYGFDFSLVVPANASDLLLPQGPIMKAMDGTLVLDASDNRTVYVIGDNGTKRGFVSATVFTQLGYSFKQAVKINLSDYTAGNPITSATDAHPDGTLVLDGKTVWWINGRELYGFPTMDVFNSYGWTFAKVLKANSADLSLPQASVLIPRSQAMASGQWLE